MYYPLPKTIANLLQSIKNEYHTNDTTWNFVEYIRQNQKSQIVLQYLKENQQLKIENKQKQLHLFFALGGILVVLLGFYNYYLYSQKEQAKLSLQLMKLKQLKDDSEKRKAVGTGKNVDRELINTRVQQYIEKCIQRETPIPISEWEELGTTINDIHNEFINKLSEICKLNSFEKQVCLLLKMNIMPTHIAKLTNHSKEAVSATRRRLYKKFFGQEGTPQQWDEFINSL